LAPNEPSGYETLGNLALSKKNYEQAFAYREKAFKLASNDFANLWGLAAVLYKAGEPERAINILIRTLRPNPIQLVGLA
jgi:tetratricopeptide (TPR) repeat protein